MGRPLRRRKLRPIAKPVRQVDSIAALIPVVAGRPAHYFDRRLSQPVGVVTHLPKHLYRKTWFTPRSKKRRVYWSYIDRKCLRHIGDVTLVLSKKRRND